MRALAKTARESGALEVVERSAPEPGADEVLVEIDYAGLCGSDGGIYEFESAFERMDLPNVIGHEYTGRVVEAGADVTAFAPGDRVVERPIRPCGECYQCRIGEENVCQNAVITGVDHDGAFAGYIAAPARYFHPVPDDVEPRHAATTEPISIGARAVIENSRVGAGDRVLVEGPGPIGLFTAQIADAQGGDVVVSGVGRDADYRLPLAEELGFETLNVADDDREAVREELTDGIGYDVVFDTTGHPSGLTTAVEEVRKGGQIVLVGQTGETTMEYSPLVRAEIDLQCSYASTYEDFERSLRMLRSGDVDPDPMLDERFSLREADEAFETFLAGDTCKVLFDPSEFRD
ncbi:zinc-dependent alcohol dehydrogenase [Halomicrobium salinisoli]|uniref:zinc-dependent alcohol dehydrogenase n=1 Tax=Halomicrobium salinisoli TaxID=2878391 RepID=UPI001CF0379C|nr:alcohol dehydrogenase catalytic domain-containing protein [Halomicrobium salinisoli]